MRDTGHSVSCVSRRLVRHFQGYTLTSAVAKAISGHLSLGSDSAEEQEGLVLVVAKMGVAMQCRQETCQQQLRPIHLCPRRP